VNNTKLHTNFNFNRYRFSNFKYTDSLNGASYNFLAYMVKGTAKIVTKAETITINEGDVFYIPKNLAYQSYWYGNSEIEFISLGFSELYTNEYIGIDVQSFPAHTELAECILSVPTSGRIISVNTLYHFYHAFSLALPKLSKSAKKSVQKIELIKDVINNNPFDSLSVIASKCGISEPYIYALFKRNTKISPNEYRQRIICDLAINLLITTDESVEKISSELNFSSSSYFRKILKKHTGLTPREIRKSRII